MSHIYKMDLGRAICSYDLKCNMFINKSARYTLTKAKKIQIKAIYEAF